jgi:hypothetical protein
MSGILFLHELYHKSQITNHNCKANTPSFFCKLTLINQSINNPLYKFILYFYILN